ncbi:hypothetical protein [Streptomyces sp. NPDC008001]|uniref:hypothetical protein n=1 Tax=Streptomyces sp. NPDC008001 TaxID=3364804 RepID=UPI0036EFF8F0
MITAVLTTFRTRLGKDFSPELVVLWAATPQPELNGWEPRAVLREGKDWDAIE